MKREVINHDERGSAILMVLGVLSIVLILAMVFAMTSRNDRTLAWAQSRKNQEEMGGDVAIVRARNIIKLIHQDALDEDMTPAEEEDVEVLYNYPLEDRMSGAHLGQKIVTKGDDRQVVWYSIKDSDFESTEGEDPDSPNTTAVYNYLKKYSDYGKLLDGFGGDFKTEIGSNVDFHYYGQKRDDGSIVYTKRIGFIIIPEANRQNIRELTGTKSIRKDDTTTQVPVTYSGKWKTSKQSNLPDYTDGSVTDGFTSVFPIFGYTFTKNSDGSIESEIKDTDTDTLRYGIHPSELLDMDSGFLAYAKSNSTHTLPDNFEDCSDDEKTELYDAMKTDLFKYNLYTGAEDYNTVSGDPEKLNLQMATNASSPTSQTTSWEDFSTSLRSPTTTTAAGFNNKINTLHSDGTSAKFTGDSSTDVTNQVWTNIVDFSDPDHYVSHNMENASGNLIQWGDTDTPAKLKITAEPPNAVCGNEKAPAVVGIYMKTLCSGKLHNEYPLGNTVDVNNSWRIDSGDAPAVKLDSLEVAVANFYNDDDEESKEYNFRIVIHGTAGMAFGGALTTTDTHSGVSSNSACLFKYNAAKEDKGEAFGSINLKNEPEFSDSGSAVTPKLHVQLRDKLLGAAYGATSFTIDKALTLESSEDVTVGYRKKLTLTADLSDLDPLISASGSTTAEHKGSFIRNLFYAVKIESIVVLARRKDDTAGLSDIVVYVPQDSGDDEKPSLVDDGFSKDSSVDLDEGTLAEGYQTPSGIVKSADIEFNKNVTGTDGGRKLYLLANDPRVNHLSKFWNKYDFWDVGAYTADGILKESMKNMEEQLKQECDVADKDPEPELNLKDGTDEITTTFSTAFIPDRPVTSMWQLGAVSRGEVGKTINLKAYGTYGVANTYDNGDGWLLDRYCLAEIASNQPCDGRINANCYSPAVYNRLFKNLPFDSDPNETGIYCMKARNDSSGLYVNGTLDYSNNSNTAGVKVMYTHGEGEDYAEKMKHSKKRPAAALYYFVNPDELELGIGSTDRAQECIYGCTAPLLTTRYESFTILAVCQIIEKIDGMNDANYDALADAQQNTIKKLGIIKAKSGHYYRVCGVPRVFMATVLHDCLTGKITIPQSKFKIK